MAYLKRLDDPDMPTIVRERYPSEPPVLLRELAKVLRGTGNPGKAADLDRWAAHLEGVR